MKYENEYLEYDDISGVDQMSLRDLPVTDLDAREDTEMYVIYAEPTAEMIDEHGLDTKPGEETITLAGPQENAAISDRDVDQVHFDLLDRFIDDGWERIVENGYPEMGDDPLEYGYSCYTVVATCSTEWKNDGTWRLVSYEFTIEP